MKKFLLFIAFASILQFVYSQPFGMGGVNWMPDGNSYTTVEKFSVFKTELPSMTKTVLYDLEKLIPHDATHQRTISSFAFSKDLKQILLKINTKTQYHKTTGEVWIYIPAKGEMFQLGKRLNPEALMYPKLSPDGQKVAYVYQDKTNMKVVYNLYVEEVKTGKIRQLTFDTKDRSINGTFDWVYAEELFCTDGFRWSEDGTRLAFWNIDASKVRNYLILNTTDSIYPYTVPVEYPKAGEDPSPAKIGVVNLATSKIKWINIEGDPRQNYLVKMEWASKNELIIQQISRKQNSSKIWLANTETGNAKTLWSDSDQAWVDMEATWNSNNSAGWNWIEGGKAFVWASEKDGWRHLYRIGMDGKESLITKGNFDVIKIYLIDESAKTVYFAATPENATQRYLFAAKLDGSDAPKRLTPANFTGTNDYMFSPNGKWCRHSFSSHLYMPASEWVTLPDHSPVDTSKSIVSNLKEDPMGKQISFFKVTTEDGITLDGWIAKPKDFDPSKKYPVFFYVYGEPWGCTVFDNSRLGRSGQFGGNIADMGYLYVSVDCRGSMAPRGREWRKSIYRKIGRLNIRDMAMGAKEVLKWNFCDTSRVAVHGWSGGGSSTLNLMFQYPEIFKTGISVAAVANQLAYDNAYQERYMGIPAETREDFIAGSPYTYAKGLKGNLLYIHGTGDDNVHYANAEKLFNELIRYNKPFQMMAYPMRSHGIYEGEGTSQHLTTTCKKFLIENCPPGGR
ncbi:MAG: DPP IV N-terminal domain-containing protein [Bacteroidia bacterium]|nr:DPP IV N-terminal domain-containing protein [Bacteroidia bacterium]